MKNVFGIEHFQIMLSWYVWTHRAYIYVIIILCLVSYIQDTWIESRMWPPTSWSVAAIQNKNHYKSDTADENKSYQPGNVMWHSIYGT